MRLITALAASALLCASTGALAESPPASSSTMGSVVKQQISKVKKDCGPDLKKLCSDVTPGNGRLLACLQSKENQLSPICKSSYEQAQATVSKKLDQEELAFRDSCGSDIQKFCSNVPSGQGRLLDCITRNKDSVSPSCQNYSNTLQQRLGDFIG